MKKFLVIAISAGALALAVFYAALYKGAYIGTNADGPVGTVFTSEDDVIMKDGEEFVIKGVEITGSIPGSPASEQVPEREDYLSWFGSISDMGANTIRVSGIMNSDFYQAFHDFNRDNEEPLYLLQGCIVEDAVNYGEGSAYDADYMGRLIEDGKSMVDVIHGNRILIGNSHGRGSGWYREDISQWVLGFLVGDRWSGDTIAYTDNETGDGGGYEGEYFVTGREAGAFEAMLARVMDEIVAYESEKYGQQHLIGFASDPSTDPLEYRDDYRHIKEAYEMAGQNGVTYARQLNKITGIDAENIQSTGKVKAGYFAAYSIYDFCDDFYEYLSREQLAEVGDILAGIDREGEYDGYLEFLADYHSMPVICCAYGFSTSRGVVLEQQGFPMDERQQGERLVAVYDSMTGSGWSGAFIDSWQDRWELRSWNTVYAQDFTNNSDWHDVQTEAQGYGLMEFVGESRIIDGASDDWSEGDVVCSSGGLTLSAYADGEGLDILVEGDGVTAGKTLYIPVDVTPKSGSTSDGERELCFSHPADFLICLSGEEGSRMLVQARYESVRANFLAAMTGEDPYISFPETDSDSFVPINMATENRTVVEYVNHSNREQTYLPAVETGLLRHGNGDSSAPDYDSQADFRYGDNCVELRIPWALLNFANPAQRLVHDDYYENYGVDFMQVDELWLGVSGESDDEIEMSEFSLKWEEREYKERFKQSYDIVKAAWR